MEKEILEFELIFLYDIYIKKKLYENILPSNTYQNIDLIDYQNKLLSLLDDFEIKINKIFHINYPQNNKIKEQIEQYFQNIRHQLNNVSLTPKRLQKFYLDYFASLNDKIVNETRNTFIGYTLFTEEDTLNIIKKCQSINEIIHVAHCLTINNYELISSFPSRDKKLDNGYMIKLHGIPHNLSQDIFNILETSLDAGDIDIFSLSKSNKVIIMIRDRGHATTMEIDDEKDKIFISYFIPKIINANMVNSLPGVNKITNKSLYTIGKFYLNKEKLNTLNQFISNIPDDTCMYLKGGIIYEKNHQQNEIIEEIIDTFLENHPEYNKKILMSFMIFDNFNYQNYPEKFTKGFLSQIALRSALERKILSQDDVKELINISNSMNNKHR